ncbi:MAG: hypothetical protein Q9185_000907 [Variospora sp. 1 TL-2023]
MVGCLTGGPKGEKDSLQALDPDFDPAGQPIPALGLILDFRVLGNFNVPYTTDGTLAEQNRVPD